jgi:hypothetical protein
MFFSSAAPFRTSAPAAIGAWDRSVRFSERTAVGDADVRGMNRWPLIPFQGHFKAKSLVFLWMDREALEIALLIPESTKKTPWI